VSCAGFGPYEHRFNMPAIAPPIIGATPTQAGCIHPAFGTDKPDCTPSAFWMEYDYGQSFYSFDAGKPNNDATHVPVRVRSCSMLYVSVLWLVFRRGEHR
jgi:hypothetical protein